MEKMIQIWSKYYMIILKIWWRHSQGLQKKIVFQIFNERISPELKLVYGI